MDLRDYLRLFQRHALFIFVVGSVSFGILYWWSSQRRAVQVEATAEVRIQEPWTIFNVNDVRIYQDQVSRASRMARIRSRRTLEHALQILREGPEAWWPDALDADGRIRDASFQALRGIVSSVAEEDTDIIRISVDDVNERRALATVNAVADAFQWAAQQEAVEGFDRQAAFVQGVLQTRRDDLEQAQEHLRTLGPPPAIAPELTTERDRLTGELQFARENLQAADTRLAELARLELNLQSRLRSRGSLAGAAAGTGRLAEAEHRVADLRGQLDEALAVRTPQHPEVRELEARLRREADLLERIREEERDRIDVAARSDLALQLEAAQSERAALTAGAGEARDRIAAMETRLAEVSLQIAAQPPDPAADDRRKFAAEAESLQHTIDTLTEDSIKLEEQRSYIGNGPVREVEHATQALPRGAVDSRRSWALSALISLVLALGAAYVIELLDTSVRTESDVKKYVNLPLYGVIGRIRKESDRLLLNVAPRSPLAEAFNTMATLVETYMRENESRLFMISSSKAEEGKSTVTSNLAVAMARGGKRVVLIDGDLRKGVLHRFFGADNTDGLGTYLLSHTPGGGDPVPLEKVLRPTGVENLTVIPAGPHPKNPVALLKLPALKELFQDLLSRFDVVLVDVPPVSVAVDTLVLAPLMDGVLFLVSAGETHKDEVTYAKRLLESANAKLVGCLLNKVTIHSRGYYYYYYYQYYYDRYKYYREP